MNRALPILVLIACLWGCAAEPPAAPEPSFEQVDVFEGEVGGYFHYRVPAIVSTAKGTLIAFAEARKSERGDWGVQDIMMRRSSDGGVSWDDPRIISRVPGPIEKNPAALAQNLGVAGEVTYNNAAPIVDRKTGALHFLFCVEYNRAFYIRSDDDGETFSDPVEITATFERFRDEYDWMVIATGPGHGIQLDNGRLIVPVWMSDGTAGHAHRPSIVSVIYSDDSGSTWERGEVVVRHPDLINPSETLAIQLQDGRVALNIRHESLEHRRAISISDDGVSGWSTPEFHDQLLEPVCMASLIRHPDGPMVFVNPHSSEPLEGRVNHKRQNVSVKISDDDGTTWPFSRSIEPGISGYSDLAVGPDGTIYCIYERGSPTGIGFTVKYLTVARFNLDWARAGD